MSGDLDALRFAVQSLWDEWADAWDKPAPSRVVDAYRNVIAAFDAYAQQTVDELAADRDALRELLAREYTRGYRQAIADENGCEVDLSFEGDECIWCGPNRLAWLPGKWVSCGDYSAWQAEVTVKPSDAPVVHGASNDSK